MIIKIIIILFLTIKISTYILKKLYFKTKIDFENIFEEEINKLQNKLNKKLNRKGILHKFESIEYLHGHPLLVNNTKLEIYIFEYGIVLLNENYKNSLYEHFIVIEKENIIKVNTLNEKDFNNNDNVKTYYLEIVYKHQKKEKNLLLSSNGKRSSTNFNYDLIYSQHNHLRVDFLKHSIESIINNDNTKKHKK